MIGLLAHRIELSPLDDRTLADGIAAMIQEQAACGASVRLPFLPCVLDEYDLARAFVLFLLPDVVMDVREALPGGRFFYALVDATDGSAPPFAAVARTRQRALIAAGLRAFDHQHSAIAQAEAA